MNKPSRIIIGAVILSLLVVLALYLRQNPASSRTSPEVVKATNLVPAMRIESPSQKVAATAPAVPAKVSTLTKATEPASTDDDMAALKVAAADIADLLQKGDFAAVANKYVEPDRAKSALEGLQRMQTPWEGIDRGPMRVELLIHAFAALADQTPEAQDDPNKFLFYDRTIYGPAPPVPIDGMSARDADNLIRIPIYFTKEDGHWRLADLTFGQLIVATNNVPLPRVVPSSP